MDPQLRDLAALGVVGLLIVAVVLVLAVERQQRALEAQLAEARSEIDALHHRLTEATRPPTQFARMHLRDVALERFARLRLAVPRRSGAPDALRTIDLTH